MRYWSYTLLMWLLWPLWMFYSYRRCRKDDHWQRCWCQLWTLSLPKFSRAPVWIHAVSLGETQAAFILIRQLKQRYPQLPILFTGGNRSAITYAQQQTLDQLSISYLPLDYRWLRQRFIRAVKPKLIILMETEFWPNLLITAHEHHIPVALVQARLSQSSRRYYPKYGQPLLKTCLAPIQFVAAQTQVDAEYLIQLGIQAKACHLLGNIKYDLQLDPKLPAKAAELQQRIGQRWIWCAGSIHEGEEQFLVEAQQAIEQSIPHSLLILVPRHPSYFNTLAQKLTQQELHIQRWSQWYHQDTPLDNTTQILLVDTLGELMRLYQLAQVCFVGGSLVPWGGHNLLEPAALAKPIIAGPHNHNFADIAQALTAHQAMYIVHHSHELCEHLQGAYQKPSDYQHMGLRAQQYCYSQQGATDRIINKLSKLIN